MGPMHRRHVLTYHGDANQRCIVVMDLAQFLFQSECEGLVAHCMIWDEMSEMAKSDVRDMRVWAV